MPVFNDFDEIERYHRGEMPPAEQAAFERRLTEEPALAMELQDYRAMARMLERFGAENSGYVESLLAPEAGMGSESAVWDYFLQRLPEPQKTRLEQKIKQDEAFARRVLQEQRLVSAIQAIGASREVVDKVVAELSAEGFFERTAAAMTAPQAVDAPPTSAIRRLPRWLALAATAVLLAGVAGLLLVSRRPPDLAQAAIDQQRKELRTILGEEESMGYAGDSTTGVVLRLAHLFEEGRPEALSELQKAWPVPADGAFVSRSPQADYLYGLFYFEKRAYGRSAQQWERLLANQPLPTMRPQALWMLAICYAQTGQPAKAREALEKLLADPLRTVSDRDVARLESMLK